MPRRSPYGGKRGQRSPATGGSDRKSTRLNSSHTVISYAVFCLKKKKHTSEIQSHSDHVCRLLPENKIMRAGDVHASAATRWLHERDSTTSRASASLVYSQLFTA